MKETHPSKIMRKLGGNPLELGGQDVTCAGEWPWENGLCFGTYEGNVWLTGIDGQGVIYALHVVKSNEAVNSIAFAGGPGNFLMATSTRAEIIFNRFTEIRGPSMSEYVYAGGAHSVISTLRQEFLAPLGPDGVLWIGNINERSVRRREIKADGGDLYFYKIASLGEFDHGGESFVCAGGESGIFQFALSENGLTDGIRVHRMKYVNIVDVCSLRTSQWPSAISALGGDGRIHFALDIDRKTTVTTLAFLEMLGCAYSMLSAKGHIFVLTSKGVYIFPDLGGKFTNNDPMYGPTRAIYVPCEAVSIHLAYGKFLIIVLPGDVWMLNIDAAVRSERKGKDRRMTGQRRVTDRTHSIVTPKYAAEPWESAPNYAVNLVEV